MKDRTLQDQRLGVRVRLTRVLSPPQKGAWYVETRYPNSRGQWLVHAMFTTPPMRTVNALQVLRATFEMRRMRRSVDAPAE